MVAWPAALPQKQFIGTVEQHQDARLRTDMDTGPAKVRRRFTAALKRVSVPIVMTGAERKVFDQFYITTLQEGSLPFDWEDPTTDEVKSYTFVSVPTWQLNLGGLWDGDRIWATTLELERLAPPPPPEGTGFIVGSASLAGVGGADILATGSVTGSAAVEGVGGADLLATGLIDGSAAVEGVGDVALLPAFIEAGTTSATGSTATPLTPGYPANLENGDFLLAVFVIDDRGAGPAFGTVPTGWTLLSDDTNGEVALRLAYRFATGGESGAISPGQTWSSVDGSNDAAIGKIYSFRNVDGNNPIDGLGTALAQGTGTVSLAAVSTAAINSLALNVFGVTAAGSNIGNPSGATGGTWGSTSHDFGSSLADDVGGDFSSAAMLDNGDITGGTVSITAGPQTQKSLIKPLALRGGLAAVGLFIAPTGDDTTGDGTFSNPWQTLGKAHTEALPGDTVWLRGGTYRLTSAFEWTASGTVGAPIKVRSYPGEVATITSSIADFETVGNSAWQIHDAPTDTYRTVNALATGLTLSDLVLTITIGGVLYKLPRVFELGRVTATTYVYGVGATAADYYVGPCFFYDTSTGHVYVRLQNLSAASGRDGGIPSNYEANIYIGDAKNIPVSDFDPRNYSMRFSSLGQQFRVDANYVTFERVAFQNGRNTVRVGSATGVTDILFDRCSFTGGRDLTRVGNNATNVTFQRCYFDCGVPPWVSWNEAKRSILDPDNMGNEILQGMKLTVCVIDDNNANILFSQNRIRSCFDGMTVPDSTCSNIQWIGNTIDYIVDDTVQWQAQTVNLEVGWNYIGGPGPGYNPGTGTDAAHFHAHSSRVATCRLRW